MARIECICPPRADGTPRHADGDEVTLKETLPFRDAVAIRNDVGLVTIDEPDATPGDILAALTESYLVHGIAGWTLVDASGRALPVSRANIRDVLLTHTEAALAVGEEADARYAEAVVLPLLRRASSSSRPTPTSASTSAPTSSSPPPPTPSSPSSISTTQTDATATTSPSPAGASS